MPINGGSVYLAGDYITPLGTVSVNSLLADKIVSDNKYLSFIPEAHRTEHIIENQLPFLQYFLQEPFKIVPMVIGTSNEKILKSIAETLYPYFSDDNLFIISADFAHYPNYRDAQKSDSLTAQAILSNNTETFLQQLRRNENKGMPGHVTSTCGSTAIQTLLYITEDQIGLQYVPIEYKNSGDAPIGDKNRVVGYFAISVVWDNLSKVSDFLTKKDKRDLLNIARATVEDYVNLGRITNLVTSGYSDNLKKRSGAFVTLNKNHNLRGCIGRFVSDEPIYKVVQEMAIAAATQDYRFKPVDAQELSEIEIEVSILTPLRKVSSLDEIELGRDGIYIVKGNHNGTFLPQVALETGWTKEEFLGHCARDKAGIGWDGWKDAEIYIYQAIVFSEADIEGR
jgi:AmmeMemoRadiSam system protein A/AmmeMemoRadiSam system protein B